ncbi:MAG: ribonuclease HII [Candidatus Paceibacterota bacterium]
MKKPTLHIGIDEAGRGPLAGPVYVGLVAAPIDFDFGIFPHLDDSKKMTERRREKVYTILRKMEEASPGIRWTTSHTSATEIDSDGIQQAVQNAIDSGLERLVPNPDNVKIYLDGGLQAPDKFKHQKTIIGGDGIQPIISLASVIAKVSRDNHMRRLDVMYPTFKLAQHKGYGTEAHCEAIQTHGPSPIHRRSYITNIV